MPTSRLNWLRDLQASLVVFLVALPLCLGIALASGAPVATGLVTGAIGGIVVGSLAGCPLQVSGPAAGLTVVCADLIRQHGLAGLAAITFFAGLLQIAGGVFRVGKWFRAVSPAVIHGMLTGIGILILAGQLHVLVDDLPPGGGLKNITGLVSTAKRAFAMPAFRSREENEQLQQLLSAIARTERSQNVLTSSVTRYLNQSAHGVADEPTSGANHSDAPAALHAFLIQQQSILREVNECQALFEAHKDLLATANPAALQAMKNAAQSVHEATSRLDQTPLDALAVVASQRTAKETLNAALITTKQQPWALCVGVLTVVIILGWGKLATGRLRTIPGALIGVVAATLFVESLNLPVLRVSLPDSLMSELPRLSLAAITDVGGREIVVGSILIALIASAETLLCATAVDKMHAGTRTLYDRELLAQGIGNTLCGFLGAIPMTGVIVRSAANVQAGGVSRLSTILHGVWLVVFVVFLGAIVRSVPISALASVLVITGYRLIDVKGFRALWRSHRAEALIFLVTVAVVVVEDLLSGVLTGVCLSALKLLLQFSQFDVQLQDHEKRCTATLVGAATFLKLPLLATALDRIAQGREVHVVLDRLTYVDHACLELLMDWGKHYESKGGTFVIDWEALHLRSGSR